MSKSRTSSIAFALVSSALTRTFGIVGAAQFTPYSKTTIALVLKEDELWTDADVKKRASHAPEGCYLSFDFVINPHSGKDMEGLDYHYSSSHNETKLSHKFSNVTLVKPNHEPTPIQINYAVSKNLATDKYQYHTPVESLQKTVLKMRDSGIGFIGVVADGEFSSQKAIEFHLENNINFLGRIKSNRTIEYNGEKMNLNKLAEKFPFKSCHEDKRVGWRSARITVQLAQSDVDILIVYRKDKGLWKPFFLVSTFPTTTSMAELLRIWKARWGIEVVHRFIKQNLGFQKCQALTMVAQQNWVNAVLDAFIAVVQMKRTLGLESWRSAQEFAAREYKNRAVTELLPEFRPKFAG